VSAAQSRPARSRPPRLRRARALVAWPERGALVVQNYVAGTAVRCDGPTAALVASLRAWTAAPEVAHRLAALGAADPSGRLVDLVAGGALLAEGTSLAARDRAFDRAWRWGPVAGAFHHALRDLPYVKQEAGVARLARLARRDPPPPGLPPPADGAVALPEPRAGRGALPVLLRRRSQRDLAGEPLALADVADVLFAGLGVRHVERHPVLGTQVFKLAPSGGARNPIEGYLCAYAVDGVAPGAYRYDGAARTLVPRARGPLPPPRLLLARQDWTDRAAAVILLAATFERTSWKYRHPGAYRVVLLEAGHVAQNLLVAACALGLAATPTCAFVDSVCEPLLGLQGAGHGLLHAVVLGRPAPPVAQGPSRARSARSSAAGG
jgi:SagB-type dehydrogenase family enzyme